MRPLLPVKILGSGSLLPGRPVSTEEICARAFPDRTPAQLIERTGIRTRWFHDPGDTTTSVAVRCARAVLSDAGMTGGDLRRLFLVFSTGGDRVLPPIATTVADAIGLRHGGDALDLTTACMGFLTAFDLAARCVVTGLGPAAVVVSEIITDHIAPTDPRPYAVFGDGAGGVVIGPSDGSAGVLAVRFGCDGSLDDSVTLARQAPESPRALIRFGASNERITDEAMRSILSASRAVLDECSLEVADVDWFVIHQPNGAMLPLLAKGLGAPIERLTPVVEEVGSVGAASMAICLDRLLHSGQTRPGQHVLLAGVGAGLSYGAMVLRL